MTLPDLLMEAGGLDILASATTLWLIILVLLTFQVNSLLILPRHSSYIEIKINLLTVYVENGSKTFQVM